MSDTVISTLALIIHVAIKLSWKNMKFSTVSIYTALFIAQIRAKKLNQPSVEIVVDPSSNNIGIDIHIDFAAPRSNLNSTSSWVRGDPSVVVYNSTAFNQTMACTASHQNGHTTAHETPMVPLPVTTQGFFPNFTSSPSASARFQSPSLLDLAAFSGGVSAGGPSGFLTIVAIALIVGV
jgi:hypothetical protein